MPIAGFGVLTQGQARENVGRYTGTSFNSSASANVFGSWVELLSSVGSIDILVQQVHIRTSDTLTKLFEIEIGIGSAGSEVTVYNHVGYIEADVNLAVSAFPNIRIPAGSRLAFRARDSIASALPYQAPFDYIKL